MRLVTRGNKFVIFIVQNIVLLIENPLEKAQIIVISPHQVNFLSLDKFSILSIFYR